MDDAREIDGQLLLDTTVYIDVLQGRAPDSVDRLIAFRICNHSAVCLAELTHAFGRLDPRDSRTASVLKQIEATVDEDIPRHRVFSPEEDTWGAAGILSGTAMRLLKIEKDGQNRFLNDALVYLQATKMGCTVLTRNVQDFDLISQLAPFGRVLFYRQA